MVSTMRPWRSRRSGAPLPLIASALFLTLYATPAQSQDWSEYLAFDDFFSANFPRDPDIRKITYETEYGVMLPARVYEVQDASGKFLVTAVDWSGAEKLHDERFAACKTSGSNACANTYRGEIRGSVANAAANLFKRGGQVAYFGAYGADGVEGLQIKLVNKDGTGTSAVIHWHENRLFIVEGTSPDGHPEPEILLYSFGFIDKDGKRVQYRGGPYSPLFPSPQRAR